MPPNSAVVPRHRADYAEAMIGLACGLMAMTALAFIRAIVTDPPGMQDFIVYWATAQQLVHHLNPYDLHALSALEHSRGLQAAETGFMRNPPWTLPLVLPLGLVGAKAGAIVWSALLAVILIAAVRIVSPAVRMAGSSAAWIGFFSPLAINAAAAGQTPLFALLGLTLFLRLHRTRPFAAGAGLALCMVKPHLLIVCVPVLLLWIVLRRAWTVLLGAVTALAVSCAVTEWIDPAAWRQYLAWAHSSGISNERMPCLSVTLRDLIAPTANWLTYVPAAIACVWAVAYFWKRREQWDWVEHGALVTLVSLLAAPYCFPWDQCLAIPALMFAAARTRSRAALAVLALSYIGLIVEQLCGVSVRSPLWLWTAPFWLGWFLWARATAARPVTAVEAAPALSVG